MKTLAICPTYGRLPFLNRSVASFLSQTHADKHMVIINDNKEVTLTCDESQVTCINISKKLLLDEKRNIGINLGNYDLIIGWDDDDISLPNRISHHVSKYSQYPTCKLFKNLRSYLVTEDEFKVLIPCPNDMSFLKSTWFEYGGYDNFDTVNGGDFKFYNRVKDKRSENDENETHYIYSRGGLNYHTSSLNIDSDELIKMANDQMADIDNFNGIYHITPDYTEYDKFLKLESMWETNTKSIPITHGKLGEINV